jgi:hypothetical protein
VSVLAGTGKSERKDGKPEGSAFDGPTGIAVHEPSHLCFVADGSNTIRKITFL